MDPPVRVEIVRMGGRGGGTTWVRQMFVFSPVSEGRGREEYIASGFQIT